MLAVNQLSGFGGRRNLGNMGVYVGGSYLSGANQTSYNSGALDIGPAAAGRVVVGLVASIASSANNGAHNSVTIGGTAAAWVATAFVDRYRVLLAARVVASGSTAAIVVNWANQRQACEIHAVSLYGAAVAQIGNELGGNNNNPVPPISTATLPCAERGVALLAGIWSHSEASDAYFLGPDGVTPLAGEQFFTALRSYELTYRVGLGLARLTPAGDCTAAWASGYSGTGGYGIFRAVSLGPA